MADTSEEGSYPKIQDSLEDLNKYYDEFTSIAQQGLDTRVYNINRAHNAVVMRVILENAKTVRMYCGEFSVFRSEFAEKIKTNDIVNTESDENKQAFITNLYDSLEKFLERGGTLDAIIENPGVNFTDEMVYRTIIKKYVDKGQVRLHTFKDGFKNYKGAFHFTLGDNIMYRRESDRELHDAICCFNNKKGAAVFVTRFDQLWKCSKPIRLW